MKRSDKYDQCSCGSNKLRSNDQCSRCKSVSENYYDSTYKDECPTPGCTNRKMKTAKHCQTCSGILQRGSSHNKSPEMMMKSRRMQKSKELPVKVRRKKRFKDWDAVIASSKETDFTRSIVETLKELETMDRDG